jgi:hypothetical protein
MSKLLTVCAIAGLACAMVSAQGQTPEPQYSATLSRRSCAGVLARIRRQDAQAVGLPGKTVVLAWFPKAFTEAEPPNASRSAERRLP